MTMTLAQRLLAVGALCLLALVALVVREGQARAAGTEVVLDMQPVDPRSLLSGHYVILNFAQRLPDGAACPPIEDTPFDRRHQGWIALAKSGERHVVSGAAGTRVKAQAFGDVLVRGAATCDPGSADATVRLDLAVDRFHTDQDEAEAIEKAIRDTDVEEARVAAILSIGADGTPRTTGLIVDGKRIELTW